MKGEYDRNRMRKFIVRNLPENNQDELETLVKQELYQNDR